MPKSCSICTHPDRMEIEAKLVAGTSLRDIAGQFAVSRNAVHRHKQNCLTSAIQAVQAEQKSIQDRSAWNALSTMQWLHEQARLIYVEVRADKDHRTSLQTLAEIRQQTKLFSELLQGVEDTTQEQREREWLNLREIIFQALEPYPEARLAVARALLALDKNDDSDPFTGEQLG